MMHRPLLHPLASAARPPQHHNSDAQAEAQARNRPDPTPNGNKPKAPAQPKNLPFTPASSQQSSRPSTPSRGADKQRLNRDKDDFASLLSGDDQPLAPMLPVMLTDNNAGQSFQPMLSETSETAQSAPPPACWQIVEPALTEGIDKQPAFPATFSLLLPQLGEVTAQVNQNTSGELEVALAFSRGSFEAVRGAQENCGRSLSQRLGQRVRLRFNLQDGRPQDSTQDKWA